MEKINKIKTAAKEQAIDEIVKKQAHDDDAWENESEIDPKLKPTSIRLSARTIQRAKFFAHVHQQRGYQSWLKSIIEERIDTEYEIFKKIKRQTEHR